MGRHPNIVILNYFDRGDKRSDNSNRYHHTCKQCGVAFPKGRMETLVQHLTKKCPSITMAERTKACLRLHELGDVVTEEDGTDTLHKGKSMNLPFSPTKQQHFNGLNVLAEASRRVGATTSPRGRRNRTTNPPLDPALSANSLASPPINTRANSSFQAPTIFSYVSADDDDSALPDFTLLAAGPMDSQLSSIAASATKSLAGHPVPDTEGDGADDDELLLDQSSVQAAQLESILPQPITRAANGPRPIAMNPHSRTIHFPIEAGNGMKVQKAKVRGRFSADRRKEVQQIRKQGACLRCRMLKKSCSEGTPCSSCRNVEHARLWKRSCIRAKMSDEFPLFSVGLQSCLAFHDVNGMKNLFKFDLASDSFDVSFSCPKAPTITFTGMRSTQPQDSNGNPVEGAVHYLLDTETDDVLENVAKFIDESTLPLTTDEQSLVKRLIDSAVQMCTNETTMLNRACSLWAASKLLTENDVQWTITIGKDQVNENSSSYLLNVSQIRAAIEKYAGRLSKLIMHDIERWLLQRPTTTRFETFLATLIFLNAAERFCWLFLSWDTDPSGANQMARWPLDKKPRPYAEQGDSFADMLSELMKTRGLTPKTRLRDDGMLEAAEDDEMIVEWYNQLAANQHVLEDLMSAHCEPSVSRSLDGKLVSRILLA